MGYRRTAQKVMETEFPDKMAIARRELEITLRWREKLEKARKMWFLVGVAVGLMVWILIAIAISLIW